MRAIFAVSVLLAISACSNIQGMDSDKKPSGQASHSSADSIGVNEASSTSTAGAEASNSSVDSIGGNTATSDTAFSAIEPEREAMFEQLIKQAVADGNDKKALKLVQDAEQAGSVKARNTYLEAVKNRP